MNEAQRTSCMVVLAILLQAIVTVAPTLRFLAWLFVPDVGAQALLTSEIILQWKAYFMWLALLYRPRTAFIFMYFYDYDYLFSIASYLSVDINSWFFWSHWFVSPGIILSYLILAVCHGLNGLTQFVHCFHLFIVYEASLYLLWEELHCLYSLRMIDTHIIPKLRSTLVCIFLCICSDILWTPLMYSVYILHIVLACLLFFSLSFVLVALVFFVFQMRSVTAGYEHWKQRIFHGNRVESNSVNNGYNVTSKELLCRLMNVNIGTERSAQQLPPSLQLPKLSEEQREQLPSELVCPLCKDLFNVPVSVPSGYSYCKECILASLRSDNYFDPVSRQQLTQDDLRFNRGLHDTVLRWCKERGVVIS